jgi:cytosine/adenosine deaminase-related metal-dependent hydrolase
LGSIEPGKYADLILVDLERNPPVPNVPAAVVYQSQGVEVDTVLCHGEVIMDGRHVHGIEDRYPDLDDRASEAARDVSERVGFMTMRNRPWTSQSPE